MFSFSGQEVELKNYAESLGLIYLSTPFSRSAADFLDEIVPAFKIGSECDNHLLIEHIAPKKPSLCLLVCRVLNLFLIAFK